MSLMIETETISETLAFYSTSMQLITQEEFVAFSHCKIFTFYIWILIEILLLISSISLNINYCVHKSKLV
jgi:hypothetical protein